MSAERLNFVEFTVDSEDRFAALYAVFAALKHDKGAGVFRGEADWLEFFDDEKRSATSGGRRKRREPPIWRAGKPLRQSND